MAIQRDSRAVDFQAQESLAGPQAQVQGVGNRNPGSVAFDFNQKYRPEAVTESRGWQTDLIAQLVGGIAPHVPDIVKNMQRNEYLEGQTAAVAKKTEEELNSNPLTNSWQIAGHRDMQNRLRIADAKVQFEKDAPALAAQSPEMMQQYLDQRRAKLLPHLSSGSGQVSEVLTAQLALDEQASQYRHGSMHKAWIANNIVSTAGAALQADNAALKIAQEEAMLSRTPEAQAAYAKQVQSTAGGVIQNIWLNPRLAGNPEVKVKFTKEAMEHALATDQIGLFDYLANTPIPLPDGTEAPLVSHMPLDDWSKLADKRRVVDDRTAVFRNMEATQQRLVTLDEMKRGEYQGSWNDITNFAADQLARKQITQGGYDSLINGYLDMAGKGDDVVKFSEMGLKNDLQGLYNAGGTPSKAIDAIHHVMRPANGKPGATLEQRVATFASAGAAGLPGAYKEAGTLMSGSLAQLIRPDGQIDKQHSDVVRGVLNSVNTLSGQMRDAALTDLLGGLPVDKKDLVLGIHMRMDREGKDFGQALSEQQEASRSLAGLSATQRARMAGDKPGEIIKEMVNYQPLGLLGLGWNNIKAVLSDEASARLGVAPRTSPWSNDQSLARFTQQSREQILLEANMQSVMNPTLDAKALILKAASEVAKRTIPTSQGPLFMPSGVKEVNTHFGLPASATKDQLASAINRVLKPTQDGNTYEIAMGEGHIAFQEKGPDGSPTSKRGRLDASTVGPAFEENRIQDRKRSDEVHGQGRTFNTGGLPVQFNGSNTASVTPTWVFDLRKNLVNNEGFRAQAYDDATGKPLAPGESPKGTTTIGVGLTKDYAPKPGPDGKVSKEQLDQAFWKASNDAAASSRKVIQAIGKPQDRDAFLLMAELAYHSGNSFSALPQYRPMLDAIRVNNREKAIEAFKGTPAWEKSGAERKKHYLKLIENIG